MRKLCVTLVGSLLFVWPLVVGAQQQGKPPLAEPPHQRGEMQKHKGELHKPLDQTAMRDVEARLKAAGFDPGPVDGTFTAETDKALRGYQQKHGLRVTGLIGDETLKALMATQARSSGAAPSVSPGTDKPSTVAPMGRTPSSVPSTGGTTR